MLRVTPGKTVLTLTSRVASGNVDIVVGHDLCGLACERAPGPLERQPPGLHAGPGHAGHRGHRGRWLVPDPRRVPRGQGRFFGGRAPGRARSRPSPGRHAGGGHRRRVHLSHHRALRLDAAGSRRRQGLLPHLQRLDPRPARAPVPAVPLCRAHPHLADRGRHRGSGPHRRFGPGAAMLPTVAEPSYNNRRWEPLWDAIEADRATGGHAPGHRPRHDLVPGSRGHGGQPAGHPVGWAHGRLRCWPHRACSSATPTCTSSSSSTTWAGCPG